MHSNSHSKTKIQTSNTAIVCLSPYYGGAEMDAFQVAKMLSEFTGITLIVKKNSLFESRHKEEAKTLGINVEPIRFFKNFSFSLIYTARKIVKNNKIKNIIYFGASELKSLYFAFLGLPINLLVKHGTTKYSSKKDFLHRLIYSKVNYHVALCNHIATNVREIIPFGKNTKLVTIYSSLREYPTNIRTPSTCKNKQVTILNLARITDGKGQIDAIKACEVLYKNKRDFIFYLVGDIDPSYREKFNNVLCSLPYKNSIKLEGFTSDVAKYFRKSDIFIFPSKGEGLSNSFIEALSYGLSCIAFNNTSFPELKKLGFDFHLAEDQVLNSLKDTLKTTVEYVDNNPVPVIKNIELAKKLFDKKREINEVLSLLQ